MSTPPPSRLDDRLPPPCEARFPRAARLLTGGDYQRVFKDAVRSRDSGFTMLAAPNPSAIADGPRARLGLAIAKRQIRHASQRNRIKRKIRESFRQRQVQLRGLDIVVLARQGVERWSGREIDAALERHFVNIRRQCAH